MHGARNAIQRRTTLTIHDAYDRVKLSLQRLNGEWSLTPETLSPHAGMVLRRDMNDNLTAGASDLAEAYAHMVVAAARFIDPADGAYDMHTDQHLIARWNSYFGAAGDMLMFDLIESLDESEREKVMLRFDAALNNANSLFQLIG
jgi:hypothetical protein